MNVTDLAAAPEVHTEHGLTVTSWGEGPDVVFLHGWAMHRGFWLGLAQRLHGVRVHLVDLPGHGESSMCWPYTTERLLQLLIQRFPGPVQVVGWSLGGFLAQQWAWQRPAQVLSLVLIGTSPCFMERPDWPAGINPAVLQNFALGLRQNYAAALDRFLTLQTLGSAHGRQTVRALQQVLHAARAPDALALEEGLALLQAVDGRAQVAQIQARTLILHGERDTIAPVAAGRWLAQHLPQAQLHTWADAAHIPFFSHAEAAAQQLQAFLAVAEHGV